MKITVQPLVQTFSDSPALPEIASLAAAALTAILGPRPRPTVVLFGALSKSLNTGIIMMSPVRSKLAQLTFIDYGKKFQYTKNI